MTAINLTPGQIACYLIAAVILAAWGLTAIGLARTARTDDWDAYFTGTNPLTDIPTTPGLLDDIAANLAPALVAEAEALLRGGGRRG